MKVAILYFDSYYDEDGIDFRVLNSVTEWAEVTEDEYSILKKYAPKIRPNTLVVQEDAINIPLKVEECLALAIEERDKQAAVRRELEEKKKATEEKRKKNALEKKRKQFEKLKKELGHNAT